MMNCFIDEFILSSLGSAIISSCNVNSKRIDMEHSASTLKLYIIAALRY
jgi:hypothetical protein